MNQVSTTSANLHRFIYTCLTLALCVNINSCSSFSVSNLAGKSATTITKSTAAVSSSIATLSKKSTSTVTNSASAVSSSIATFSKNSTSTVTKSVAKLRPKRVPIVSARVNELKELPSGADRALAWERQQTSKQLASYSLGSWFIPKSFKAPTLPDDSGIPISGSLLPPLQPSPETPLKTAAEKP